MDDERVWLTHPEHGGSFACPIAAAPAWRAMGWVDGEEPVTVDPAVVERIAWEQEQAAARAARDAAALEAAPAEASKSSRDGGTEPDTAEE